MNSGIRAPRRHGELACDPPLGALAELAHKDVVRPSRARFQKIQEVARREILAELGPAGQGLQVNSVWIGVGHQPEVFHPGVWAKNFLAGGLASQVAGNSLNVVVDTDSPNQVGVKVPSLELGQWPRKTTLWPFAPPNRGSPWFSIARDETIFKVFKSSLLDWSDAAPWVSGIRSWFQEMDMAQGPGQTPLWRLFQNARHGLENGWGLYQPSLSLATLTEANGFRLFLDYFLSDYCKGQATYNEALSWFRNAQGIRDSGRPVPDLEKVGEWTELPFWVFLPAENRRSRLWCRQDDSAMELGATREWGKVPESLGRAVPGPGDSGNHFDFAGIAIWPRALATTLFLRGFVFDCFVHGIGGALYDQVTEKWARLWLQMDLGPRVASSLTMRLPLPPARATWLLAQSARHSQRHLFWNPDLLLKGHEGGLSQGEFEELAELRSGTPTKGEESKSRFFKLRILGDKLRERARGILDQGWREVDHLFALSPEEKVVSSREYAFPLHPFEELKKKLQPLLELREAARS